MPFDPGLRLTVQRKAHFHCCLCHDLYVEIHHIIPESEGGPSTEDNAAPLCPSCHEKYGANATKRTFIRNARDFWYEICADRYKPADDNQLAQIDAQLRQAATKADLTAAIQQMAAMLQQQIAPAGVSFGQAREAVAHVTASVVSSMAHVPLSSQVSTGDIFKITGSEPPKVSIAESKTPIV